MKPYPGRVVSKSQINAIVHLVSSSIPYLSRENVTVVDNMGQLLTDTDGDSALALTTAQTEHRTSVEANYQQRIQQMLSAIVGLGNVRTEVNVSVNFTEVESTFEEYDREGNGPRTRSESLQLEKDSQPEAAGVPGGSAMKHLKVPHLLRQPQPSTLGKIKRTMFLAVLLLEIMRSTERSDM